ncbi:hypothetical protein [Eikenella corrodens]|uniref:hypothetical protein n=1 Tax=Eikenella corrodens TaxID=539 RepID=UPI00241ECFE2|nr:hypothetical protein [Eikenella corrodens]
MQQRKQGQPLEVTQKIVASKALGVASATTCEAEKDCTQNAANRRSCKTAGAEDDGFEQKRGGILGVCLESVKQNLWIYTYLPKRLPESHSCPFGATGQLTVK